MNLTNSDNLSLLIELKVNNSIVTDTTFDDVRIQVGDILKSFSDYEITYDSDRQKWNFPITFKEFQKLHYKCLWAFGIKNGNDWKYSDNYTFYIDESITTEDWR